MNGPQNLGPGAEVNAIAQNRRASLSGILQSYRDSVADDAIISENRVATDDDAPKMVDSETPTKSDLTWKLNARQDLRKRLQYLVQKGKWHPQPAPANGVAPPSKAIYGHYPKALTEQRSVVSTPIFAQILKQDPPQSFEPKCSTLLSIQSSRDYSRRWPAGYTMKLRNEITIDQANIPPSQLIEIIWLDG
jgi:hypothetical protein